ncbi:GntR family transcriptional regulator [Streptomyces sp. CB00316]|uniref:GntR family transcriptional regulator n=1 Tax=unclassified Streptomyces TaxID=2593676 RepID=UPI00093C5898|nr:GntR family transcriptional regulator [Streptomyces sp. CB00316]OKJ22701.1 GntR family transcriptional regulator [Streptomyces sp. CB00316]
MVTEGSGREPKYRRIANALKAEIQSGALGPGARLPGENDLMAQHGVARMTVRQALGVLQSEGLTEARKGAGVFVRAFQPLRRRGIQRLAREQWGGGRSIWEADLGGRDLVVDQVDVRRGTASDNAARVLDLGEGDAACIRSRRFVLDGKPVLLATSYLPNALVEGSPITEVDTGPGGIYARLAELGHKPVHFREEIRSRMPLPEETSRLGLPAGTPVMLVCRTAFAEDGSPVEVNEMVLDAAAYVLEYDFDA